MAASPYCLDSYNLTFSNSTQGTPIYIYRNSNILNYISFYYHKNYSYKKYLTEKKFFSIIVSFFLVISFLGALNKLPLSKKLYKNSIFSQNELLKAYLYLFEEKDVHAILNFAPWSVTGGYYYLHQDIPIFSAEHFKLNDSRNNLPYISHIICPVYYKEISGFGTLVKFHKVEIRKQINPPSEYQKFPEDTKNVMQKGIDDKYVPDL